MCSGRIADLPWNPVPDRGLIELAWFPAEHRMTEGSKLTGAVAIVTGASAGIGEEIAKTLAREGASDAGQPLGICRSCPGKFLICSDRKEMQPWTSSRHCRS